ncbi:MAG: hypothetical protein AAGU77_09795, partial [Bacillota bacterium]
VFLFGVLREFRPVWVFVVAQPQTFSLFLTPGLSEISERPFIVPAIDRIYGRFRPIVRSP